MYKRFVCMLTDENAAAGRGQYFDVIATDAADALRELLRLHGRDVARWQVVKVYLAGLA